MSNYDIDKLLSRAEAERATQIAEYEDKLMELTGVGPVHRVTTDLLIIGAAACFLIGCLVGWYIS